MKQSTLFYDNYHRLNKNRKFFKSINDYNFTYFLTIKLINRVFSYLKKKEITVLDLGCGVGAIDFYLAKKGHKILGVDISEEAVSIANAYKDFANIKSANFEVNDVTSYTAKKNFDFVICSEVIEHVKDEHKLLTTIYNSLKKNGYLLLTTPSINAPLYKLGLLTKFDQDVGHLRRYDFHELKKKLEKYNFEIVFCEKNESILRNSLYTFPLLGNLIRLFKIPFIVVLFHKIDAVLVNLWGESNMAFIARKK